MTTTNITLDIEAGDQGLDASDISHIVHLVIQYPLFMIGFFLHIKNKVYGEAELEIGNTCNISGFIICIKL